MSANAPALPAGTRIVHIVDSLERGGLERMVCDLATQQHARGQDVSVYCLHRRGALAEELERQGIRVHSGNKRRGPDLRVIRQLRDLMRPGRRTIFHSHSMMPNYYACAAALSTAMRIRVVNTRHDMGSTIRNDLRERLYRISVPLTSRVVLVSAQVRQRFISSGIVPARKARMVLNGITTDGAQRTDDRRRESARHALATPSDCTLIGCVGRLVELKNHGLAVRTLATLRAERPNVRLVLIGGGPLRESLQALAESLRVADAVLFTGERPDVRDLLPALDVFLMPSKTEGHSIALLEACAAALPVIATAVGGNPEIVAHGQTGLLVPVDDEAALLAALRQLVSNDAFASALGGAARAWVTSHVSVSAMADAYERVYAEAA